MRLGLYPALLKKGTIARKMYNKEVIRERHRHRYEVNDNYVAKLEAAGLRVAGRSIDNALVEVIELIDHPWFVACQFHPEFRSRPHRPHPVFQAFIKAAIKRGSDDT